MYQNNTTFIHSSIADGGLSLDSRGYAAIKLWYACRAIDQSGSGRVQCAIADLANVLQVSIATIRRYLKDGKRLKFFRDARTAHGIVTVFYSSTVQVCMANGLESLGAVTEVAISDLHNLKAIATQAEAQKLQQASYHKARKGQKRPIPTANELIPSSVKSQPCKRSGASGQVVQTGDRFLFVSPDFIPFGGSQRTAAKNLGRSSRTVARRLSNRDRFKKGLPILERRQLAIVCTSNQTKAIDALRLSGDRSIKRVFSASIGAIVPKCNIYLQSLALRGCRRLRTAVSRAVKNLLCVRDYKYDTSNN